MLFANMQGWKKWNCPEIIPVPQSRIALFQLLSGAHSKAFTRVQRISLSGDLFNSVTARLVKPEHPVPAYNYSSIFSECSPISHVGANSERLLAYKPVKPITNLKVYFNSPLFLVRHNK